MEIWKRKEQRRRKVKCILENEMTPIRIEKLWDKQMTDSKGEAEKGSGMMLWKKPIPISTCTS